MKRLENWAIVGSNPYYPPECQSLCLKGDVYGHELHFDGKCIRTSTIEGIEGELVKTYSGSLYELGEVNPEYEALYPNAKERLFARIKEVNEKSR